MRKKIQIPFVATLAAALIMTGCSAADQSLKAKNQSEETVQNILEETLSGTVAAEASIHAEASDESAIIQTLPAGARISLSGAQKADGWVNVMLGEKSGWIKSELLTDGANSKSFKIPTVYKTNSKAVVRAKASLKGKRLGTYKKGSQLNSLGVTSNKKWVKVPYKSGTGWMSLKTLTKQPHTKYTLKSTEKMWSKVLKGKKIATLQKGQEVTHTGRTTGSYLQVSNGSKLGWVKNTKVTRSVTAKYKVKSYTTSHNTPGGKKVSELYKGQVIAAVGTKTTKHKGSSWTRVRIGSKDRWVISNKLSSLNKRTANTLPTKHIAKYKATSGTNLYSAPNSKAGSKLASGYVVGSPSKDIVKQGGKSWLHIYAGGKHQWVQAAKFKTVDLSTALGAPKVKATPKPTPQPTAAPKPTGDIKSMTRTQWSDTDYVAAIKSNIAPWCPRTPVKLAAAEGTYYATSHPQTIYISRVGNPNPNWPNIYSVSLHECAHILQFTAYEGNLSKLDKDMDPLWPAKSNGVEYLADCISDVMGGKRSGSLPNGWTYWSGYGQTCNATQTKAAKVILSGKML